MDKEMKQYVMAEKVYDLVEAGVIDSETAELLLEQYPAWLAEVLDL